MAEPGERFALVNKQGQTLGVYEIDRGTDGGPVMAHNVYRLTNVGNGKTAWATGKWLRQGPIHGANNYFVAAAEVETAA